MKHLYIREKGIGGIIMERRTFLEMLAVSPLAIGSAIKGISAKPDLEQVAQEATPQQAPVEIPIPAELRSWFTEANTVTISTIKEKGVEYNKPNKGVFSLYIAEKNIPYKLNTVVYGPDIYKTNTIIKKADGTSVDIKAACKGVLPDTTVPDGVLAAAKADSVAATQVATPILETGQAYILFLKDIKRVKDDPSSKVAIIGHVPATDENKGFLERLAREYKR
ncbi:MAG: hypothetical protein V1866_06495 [archaeon]